MSCDWVQGDVYAPPSRFHLEIPNSYLKYPTKFFENKTRRVALGDYMSRLYSNHLRTLNVGKKGGSWKAEKGGAISIAAPGQYVLDRTSVIVQANGDIELRLTVELPAQGRTISGMFAEHVLCNILPNSIPILLHQAQDVQKLWHHISSVEDQETLRKLIVDKNLVSFVANGSVLPRRSGDSHLPIDNNSKVVLFNSPKELQCSFTLPHKGEISGMGIPKGITLIVGGGFHGKSTLLQSIEVGVYNKIPGDGREFVVSDPNVVKIKAEDGRYVESVNISMFINNLPFQKDTTCFSTPCASGSTSQAASFVEAMEVGATAFLIDEDQSASNLLFQDQRMQKLVTPDQEPISAYVTKAKQLLVERNLSTIIVLGASSAFFEIADLVIKMVEFVPRVCTSEAKKIASEMTTSLINKNPGPLGCTNRIPLLKSIPDRSNTRIKVIHQHLVSFGDFELNLSALDQVVEVYQTNVIVDTLNFIAHLNQSNKSLKEILEEIEGLFDSQGLDAIQQNIKTNGSLSRPRMIEIAMALNRLRSFKAKQLNQ
uniref:ABC transporter domain-containing protein n=1 Tax=Arcella intermedia TaxID=1963864 RepID=A0A6B2L0N2_9EUKA